MQSRLPAANAAAASNALARALPLATHAQSQIPLDDVVVTATRAAQPLTQLLANVTVVSRDAIDRSGAAAVADVLSRVPGVELARNSGSGATTSVFARGAESRFTAVYIGGQPARAGSARADCSRPVAVNAGGFGAWTVIDFEPS